MKWSASRPGLNHHASNRKGFENFLKHGQKHGQALQPKGKIVDHRLPQAMCDFEKYGVREKAVVLRSRPPVPNPLALCTFADDNSHASFTRF